MVRSSKGADYGFGQGLDRKPQALLFDLFQTLVFFDASKLPSHRRGGKIRPTTIANLEKYLVKVDRYLEAEYFLTIVTEISSEISKEKRRTGAEVSSVERFRRSLHRAVDGSPTAQRDQIDVVAGELVDVHMSSLASAVRCPGDREALLRSLLKEYRVGLVSNFDHGPTAHRILDAHGLTPLLEVRVVSDDLGISKPNAAIFHEACNRLGVSPAEAVFVGDSMVADVEGAHGAGLAPVWISDGSRPAGPARAVISDVSKLPALLADLPTR